MSQAIEECLDPLQTDIFMKTYSKINFVSRHTPLKIIHFHA